MRESLEDRISLAGMHDEFKIDIQRFRDGEISGDELYDLLTDRYDASPEEADEFVNMLEEDDD